MDPFDTDALAPSTLKTYQRHVTEFQQTYDVITEVNVLEHLGTLRTVHGLSMSSMRQSVAALGFVCRRLGLEDVSQLRRVKDYLGASSRADERPVRQASALTRTDLIAAEPTMTPEHYHMLGIGLGTGLRRSELAAIHSDNLTETTLFVPRGKRGSRTVNLSQKVRSHLENFTPDGYLFAGKRGAAHVSENTINRLVKHVAEVCGLNPGDYSGHSLRSGYVTAALEAGIPATTIMVQTGHKTVEQVMAYGRRSSHFEAPEI